MLWPINKRIEKRLGYLGIPLAFIIPSASLILWGSKVQIATGLIICVVGVLLILPIVLIPLHKEIPPREHSFKKHGDIWGLWYTGRGVLASNLIGKYPKKVKRVLLLNPESSGFEKNMEETAGNRQYAKETIINLTKIAQGFGIHVKWYDNAQGKSLTFYDPLCDKTALLVWQEEKPNTPAAGRPLYKFTKNEAEFDECLDLFNRIWDNQSQEPSIHEGDTDDEKRTEN